MSVAGADQLLSSILERICEECPKKPAIIYLGEKYSYAKLKELIDRFATALYGLGVRENDRVMIYIPNSPQYIIAFFGAQEIGAVPVPVSPIYTPREIVYMTNHAGIETIVCQDTNFGYVREAFSKTCLKRVIVTSLVDFLPWWKRAIGALFDRVPHGGTKADEGVHFFKKLVHKYPARPPKVDINPKEHLAYLMYTSGTLGVPKAVPGTYSTMGIAINDYLEATKDCLKKGDEVLLLVLPLFHILGKIATISLSLMQGNTTVLLPVPQVDAILEAIQRHKATLFLGVPTLYRMILENDRLDLYDLSSLRYCWSGGDILPTEVYNRWKQKFGVPIYQMYGSTEIITGALSQLSKMPAPGSLGPPSPSKEVKIVDPDTLELVPLNTAGELLVSSKYIPKAYWNNPEETARSYLQMDDKTWYRTGDYVRMDEDGSLYFVGRRADVIKCKGYRVSAVEIEAVLQDHPAVIEACVVGVLDPKVGERIKAMVVLKEDAKGVGASELTKWCRERLAAYKIPGYIEFRDMLPKSKVGKLLRREIRDEERRKREKRAVNGL